MILGREVKAIAGFAPKSPSSREVPRAGEGSDVDEGRGAPSLGGFQDAVPDVFRNTAFTFDSATPLGASSVKREHRPFPTHNSPVA